MTVFCLTLEVMTPLASLITVIVSGLDHGALALSALLPGAIVK